TFTAAEREQLDAVTALVLRYLNTEAPKRPLCLAIFGPPGSGKSTLATGLNAVVRKRLGWTSERLPFHKVNLTQVASVDALGAFFGTLDGGGVPYVLIDEFDANRDGRA